MLGVLTRAMQVPRRVESASHYFRTVTLLDLIITKNNLVELEKPVLRRLMGWSTFRRSVLKQFGHLFCLLGNINAVWNSIVRIKVLDFLVIYATEQTNVSLVVILVLSLKLAQDLLQFFDSILVLTWVLTIDLLHRL